MNDLNNLKLPAAFSSLQAATDSAGFKMACEPLTGALLRTLAASKPAGQFLEIGTGTGIGSCWILDGMDKDSHLISVERDAEVSTIAQRILGHDPRVQFIVQDAEVFLHNPPAQQFDFIFADTFPGKFYLLDEALALLKPGGLYIIDDLRPQSTWPDNHQTSVDRLIATLEAKPKLRIVKMVWASGLIIATNHA